MNVIPRMVLIALGLVLGPALAASAGQLTLAWPPSGDDLTVGYRVYVGVEPGQYDRVVDAGDSARAVIDELADGVVYYFAVKGYDEAGNESPSFSSELASLPRPRVDWVDPPRLLPGEAAYITLQGANFDPEVRVALSDPRLVLRSSVVAGAGVLVVEVEALPAAPETEPVPIELTGPTFTLVNPGRKADAYFESHPEVVDLDGSGWIDESDLDRVRAAFGTRQGDEQFRRDADLDGDGMVDAADLQRMTARLGMRAIDPPTPATAAPEASTEGE